MKKSLAYGAIAAAALTGAAAGADVFAEETESSSAADTITAAEIEGTDWALPEESVQGGSANDLSQKTDLSDQKTDLSEKETESDLSLKAGSTGRTDADLLKGSSDLTIQNKESAQTLQPAAARDSDRDGIDRAEAEELIEPVLNQVQTSELLRLEDEDGKNEMLQPENPLKTPDATEGWNSTKTGYFRDGAWLTGIQSIDGQLYYFNADGALQHGLLQTDENNNLSWICADLETGALLQKFQTLGEEYGLTTEKTVYFDETGYMHYGWLDHENQRYYLSYLDGSMLRGQKKISDGMYCFDLQTGIMKTGFTYLDRAYDAPGKTVYYGEDGAMRFGQQFIGNKWYCFDLNDGHMKTGLTHLSSAYESSGPKTVFYQSTGLTKDGLGQMLYGFLQTDEGVRYFKPVYGTMVTDTFMEIDNGSQKGTIYFDENGIQARGEKQTAPGEWRYFDRETGFMTTGFKALTRKDDHAAEDKIVYYGQDGVMLLGQQMIGKFWYCFDMVTGKMMTGLTTLNADYEPSGAKTVYYQRTGTVEEGLGRMLYGLQNIDGKTYYFKPHYGTMAADSLVRLTINGKSGTVYFDQHGVMAHGEKMTAPGQWRFFDQQTGFMVTGFYYLKASETNFKYNRVVYYGDDGIMRHGQHRINGSWYCFDLTTGDMKTGLTYLDHSYEKSGPKRVYYYNSGTIATGLGKMLYGEIRTGGKVFYAQPDTGAIQNSYVVKEGNVLKIYGYDGLPGRNIQGHYQGGWYYFGENGTSVKNTLITLSEAQTSDGPKTVYYGGDGRMIYGMHEVNGRWKYFTPESGAMVISEFTEVPAFYSNTGTAKICYFDQAGNMVTGTLHKGAAYLEFDDSGALIACSFDDVPYYSQRDPRWSGTYIGSYTMGGSACVPTVITMIVNTLNQMRLSPVNVAADLYNNGYMNVGYQAGCGADALLYAGDRYDLQVVQLSTRTAVEKFLKMGAMVAAAMNPGIFTEPGTTHEILLYGYEDGQTNVFDPYWSSHNGSYSVSTVWNQQSTDAGDCAYGAPFYAFIKM